jgi:hypothetical protein
MSLTAFKRKSVIQYGSKRSGKPPGGYWLPQGPFGASTVGLQQAINYPGAVGFSLNGPHRNVGYVGKDSKFSKSGTPYRGTNPIGWGGCCGTYKKSESVFNVNEVNVLGDQWLYVKPTVLTTKGMLENKYRCAYNGQYPNSWVQPVNDGTTQSDTKSQGMYLHNLTTANICVTDINNYAKYVGYIKRGGPTLCYTTTARFKYDDMVRNAPYTKELRQPETSSQHTLRIQRRCANPLPYQKPFPYAVQTGTGILTGGINMTSVGNSGSCSSNNKTYTVPPPGYNTSPSGIN